VYGHGWSALCAELAALNVLMALIAWLLPDDRAEAASARRELENQPKPTGRNAVDLIRTHVEWRVLFLSVGMALMSFGWGSLTSFSSLFADEIGVMPRSLFLSAMSVATLTGRLTIGRTLDRRGYRSVLLRCFLAPPAGLALLALAQGPVSVVISALVFGAGFGLTHPAYTAYIMGHVTPARRGAAFGAMLAAFDTGIGLGSSTMGWLAHAFGFRLAFAASALVAACSLPYFLFAERRLGFRD
jgi:predicted MFS family arabinose efflux permease